MVCHFGHPAGQSVQRARDVRAFVRMKFAVSGLNLVLLGTMITCTVFNWLRVGSAMLIFFVYQ
jgi:hypothetical protein